MENERDILRRTAYWHCGGELVWAGDYTFDELGIAGDGLVYVLNCYGCGAIVEYYVGDRVDDDM